MPNTKIRLKWIKDVKIKAATIKFFKKKKEKQWKVFMTLDLAKIS